MRLARGMECRVSKDPATSTSNILLQSCEVEPGSWSIAPSWAWPAVAAAIASRPGWPEVGGEADSASVPPDRQLARHVGRNTWTRVQARLQQGTTALKTGA